MRSMQPLARMRLLIPLSAALLLSACAGGPPIVAAPSACSSLVPSSHRQPVPGADLPPLQSAVVGDWVKFGDAQTAQLDKANGRHADDLEVIENCEKRDARTVARLQSPWWQRPFQPKP